MIFMYSGILTNWQYIFMIGQGFSNRQRLAFHSSPSFIWCLPLSMLNSLPGKTNLKALYCLLATQFHTKRFFSSKNRFHLAASSTCRSASCPLRSAWAMFFVGGLIFKVCAWTSPGGNPSLTPTDQGSVPKFNKNSIRILSKSPSWTWP